MYSTRGVVIDVTSRAACDKEKIPRYSWISVKFLTQSKKCLKFTFYAPEALWTTLLVGLAGTSGSCRDEIRNMLSLIKMRTNLCILAFFVNSVQCICRIG